MGSGCGYHRNDGSLRDCAHRGLWLVFLRIPHFLDQHGVPHHYNRQRIGHAWNALFRHRIAHDKWPAPRSTTRVLAHGGLRDFLHDGTTATHIHCADGKLCDWPRPDRSLHRHRNAQQTRSNLSILPRKTTISQQRWTPRNSVVKCRHLPREPYAPHATSCTAVLCDCPTAMPVP